MIPNPKILSNTIQWDDASHEERVAIAKAIAAKLGPDFMYVGFDTHSAGGQSHEMMALEHQPTLMVFHIIPGGAFTLGCSEEEQKICDANGWNGDLPETPTNQLTIAPFLMANSTATEYAMKAFKGETDKNWKFGQLHPADAISRTEARAWCRKYGMRLPNEPEWEYACRAGSRYVFYWGNQLALQHCWMTDNSADAYGEYTTHSYMEHLKFTNAFGLIDMLGSMSEWVEDDRYHYDWHDFDGPFEDVEHDNPDGILRGGCFMYGWKFNRCATRISCADYGDTGISFRPVMDIPELDFELEVKERSETEAPKSAKKWWKPW